MMEFGSDFHFINNFSSGNKSIKDFYPNCVLVANGRQAIEILILINKWKRIWMPEYFCWDITESIKEKTGIEIKTYPDFPLANDTKILKHIQFQKGDVLLRMNFFGLRGYRSNKGINIPVIEDHSHDLIGQWARLSDADYCIASLRKSLPIAEGGIIWSPMKHELNLPSLSNTHENEFLAKERWEAMKIKKKYISSPTNDLNHLSLKKEYRKIFIKTEKEFERIDYSIIDKNTDNYLNSFDIISWYKKKNHNHKILTSYYKKKEKSPFTLLIPENQECNPFSFTIFFNNKALRDEARSCFINNYIYPAILWPIPEYCNHNVVAFSTKMLSIHCDGRYSELDLEEMINKMTFDPILKFKDD